jgi:hypothetical protein
VVGEGIEHRDDSILCDGVLEEVPTLVKTVWHYKIDRVSSFLPEFFVSGN